MKKITDFIVKWRNLFLVCFILLSILALYINTKVNINDDIMKYLPVNSETKKGKDIMDKEFEELDSSNLNVMFKNLSKKEKEETLEKLEKVKGVDSVSYDDTKEYNKGKHTLYVLNVNDYAKSKTSENVYKTVKKDFKVEAMSGTIYDEYKPVLQVWIVFLSIGFALVILILLSESYIEPFLYLVSIGIAVFINKGTNIMFSSVSSITNAITAVLQLALSMDYSIMLSNRFKQEKRKTDNKIDAMKNALYHSFKAISSSSITTVVGLLALVFMSFTIGKDLGFVLAKGVLLSLISIFCCLPALLLLFDNLISKSKKKSLKFDLTKLGRFSYLTRFPQLFIVFALFIIAFILKGNINILYTGSEQDEVGKIFKANNQIAIVYDNKYEKFMADYCKKLEENKKIDQVLCYGNTISEGLKYNGLTNKLADLGQKIEIDDDLLKILYFNYFNKSDLMITPDQFINTIQNDIYSNKKFNTFITNDIKDKIELLSNFTNKDKVNKNRSIEELSELLSIDKKDLEKILILYNSENNTSKMTIKSLIDFLLNDVANDGEYSSYLSTDIKNKLKELKVYTDKEFINKKLSSSEIAKLMNVDEKMVSELFLFYKVNSESSTKLKMNDFAKFTLALSQNDSYKSEFNNDIVSKITILDKLSTENIISQKLDETNMKSTLGSFGISLNDSLLNNLYILYNGANTSTKLTLKEFANIAYNLSQNESYSSYFSEETVSKLQSIINLSDNADTVMPSTNLYLMFNIPDTLQQQLNYAIAGNQNASYNMTPKVFIETLLSNDNIKSNLSEDAIAKFNESLFIMNNTTTKYNQNEISNILKQDKTIVSIIFGYYEEENNSLNNISINELINFIYMNKDNKLIKNSISNYTDMITLAYNIMNNLDIKYSYKDIAKLIGVDPSLTKKIYGIYDYQNSETKLSVYEVVSTIINNKDNKLLKGKISSDKLSLLKIINEVMTSTMNNKKYSPSDLSKLLGTDKKKINIIYSLYDYKNNKGNKKLSINKLVTFIKNNVLTNDDYKSSFSEDKINKVNAIYNIVNASVNDTKLSSTDLYNNLKVLSNKMSKNLLDVVYVYYGSIYEYDDSWEITIEEFVSYLNNDIINDKRFSDFLDNNMKIKIKNADETINKSKKLLVSDKYSRVVLNTSYEFETKDTFNFINGLKKDFNGKDKIYVVGHSPMAVEMSKTFNNELNRITVLTMIFIFIVVAFTFKDLIIPFILVLIIQTAVYVTMSAISITGGNVYFISLIIVQAILMGATIDYAIVYTSYYRESREKYDVKTSIVKAYNKSIHTIISSSSILIIVTLVVSNFADAIAAKICETISQGAFAATLLILLVLPGTLAATDKLICRVKKYKKEKI